jgi:hypothetical protein
VTRFDVADAIEIKCYGDLLKLPGFTENVPKELLKNVRKLATYTMENEIRCGIAECHQPHKEGCAIEIPDLLSTNIGHCCAAKIIGASWTDIKKDYIERRMLDGKKRDINVFLDDPRAIIKQAFDAWYQGDVRWLQLTREEFFNGAPTTLLETLAKRAKSNNTRVTQSRERDENDWTAHLAFSSQNDDKSIVTIPVGDLSGLTTIKLCAADLVDRDVVKMASQWAKQNPLAMSNDDIGDCASQIRAFPRKLRRARELVAEGRAFFTPQNFALFTPLLEQDCRGGASAVLRHYEWDFEKDRWSISPKLGRTRKSDPRAA